MSPDDAPSQDLGAEQALLGACLLSPTALDEVTLAVTQSDFYRPAHGELLAAMITLRDKGEPVDALTLGHFLRDQGSLERLGGLGNLHSLIASVPTATNALYYAEIIRDHAKRRGLETASQRIAQLARQPADDVDELIERARDSVDGLAFLARGGNDAMEIGDLANLAIDRYSGPAPDALSTGMRDLDAVLSGGLRPGTLTVIAARPGQGKTVLGGNIALRAALAGKGVLFFELEMTRNEIIDRAISDLGSIRLDAITNHRLSAADWESVRRATARLQDIPLAIVDEPHMNITGIRSRARDRMRTARGLDLIVVDQLNLIATPSRSKREEEVAELARNLKLLAKELNIPVIIMHQLNRESEKRTDKKPQLSDLRESGMVEANADIAILLHPQPKGDPREGEIDLILAKNRQGPQCTVAMAWTPHFARVADMFKPGGH